MKDMLTSLFSILIGALILYSLYRDGGIVDDGFSSRRIRCGILISFIALAITLIAIGIKNLLSQGHL